MGLKPTTFELEVQRAYPLCQEGTALGSDSGSSLLASWKIFWVLENSFWHCNS